MTSTKQQPTVTPERIMQFAFGFAPPLIIEVAVHNRIFDLLDAGPKTLQDVCTATGNSERGLRALMNALVGLGLLAKDTDGRYMLTDESSAFLVSTRASFHGGIFQHCSDQLIPKWLDLRKVVQVGEPAVAVNHEEGGAEFFRQFVESIFPLSYPATQVLADALAVSTRRDTVSVLDLAAGSGVWGIGLAQKSKKVRVCAVDWAEVLDVTRRMAARFGVQDQFTFVAGDILEVGFGSGYSIATLGHILHSEGTQRSQLLLKKTFNALAPGGTIAIADWLVDEKRTEPPRSLIFAVNMLVSTKEGDTFSFQEISQWLQSAGFTNARTIEAPGPSPLILATKPDRP